jgi:hypothetical protein
MVSEAAAAGASMDSRSERYRRAERSFWEHYGLEPMERFVDVGSPPGRLRVQEGVQMPRDGSTRLGTELAGELRRTGVRGHGR